MELTAIEPNQVVMIPLTQIEPDPEQPRKSFNQESLQQLADDIKANGIQQPITVRKPAIAGDPYIIKYGERRYLASKLANKRAAPCILAQPEKGERPKVARIFAQAKENHLRDELNPMDWALTFRQLKESGMQVKEIAEACAEHGLPHMSRPHISNLMRLTELPDWAQQLIVDKRISAAHGKYLFAALASDDVTELVRERMEAENEEAPSVRELQGIIDDAFREKHRQAYELNWPGYEDLAEKKKDLGLVEIPDGAGRTTCYALDVERYEAAVAEHRQNSFELNGDDEEDEDEESEHALSTSPEGGRQDADPFQGPWAHGMRHSMRCELSVQEYAAERLLEGGHFTDWDFCRLALWKACEYFADNDGKWEGDAADGYFTDEALEAIVNCGAKWRWQDGWSGWRALSQADFETVLTEVGRHVVANASQNLLARFVADNDITLEHYRVNERYCESCTRDEIESMVRQVHETVPAAPNPTCWEETVALLTSHAELFGTPEAIVEHWTRFLELAAPAEESAP